MRVDQESDIEHKIGIDRQSKLEAETMLLKS